jgi:hypothetical protein
MSARRHRTRSIITRLVVFLLLGAVVNVAVAWGCMVTWPARVYNENDLIDVAKNPATELLVSTWNIDEPLRRAEIKSFAESRVGWIQYTAEYFPDWDSSNPVDDLSWFIVLEAGWPARSLRGDFRAPPGVDAEFCYALMIPDGWRPAYGRITLWSYFPILPIWPGFAINTFFYAAILWLLFAFPFALRRWRRVRRGLCATCSYPVGASDVCTECGAAIRSRTSVATP